MGSYNAPDTTEIWQRNRGCKSEKKTGIARRSRPDQLLFVYRVYQERATTASTKKRSGKQRLDSADVVVAALRCCTIALT